MNDKFLGFIVAFAVFAACCLGVPALIGLLSVGSLVAWLAGTWLSLALIIGTALVIWVVKRSRDRAKNDYALARRPRRTHEIQF